MAQPRRFRPGAGVPVSALHSAHRPEEAVLGEASWEEEQLSPGAAQYIRRKNYGLEIRQLS